MRRPLVARPNTLAHMLLVWKRVSDLRPPVSTREAT